MGCTGLGVGLGSGLLGDLHRVALVVEFEDLHASVLRLNTVVAELCRMVATTAKGLAITLLPAVMIAIKQSYGVSSSVLLAVMRS
jgi:hypothetical protein